jgi:hypothetical protein
MQTFTYFQYTCVIIHRTCGYRPPPPKGGGGWLEGTFIMPKTFG